jgi:hypothetical protein
MREFRRHGCALVLLAAPLWVANAAVAAASTDATTGGATSIAVTSATLDGVVDTIQTPTTWRFQFGPSVSYGSLTPARAAAQGLTAVAATIKGLKPSTTYHYRLVVAEGIAPTTLVVGADRTLETASASGRASLGSRELRLRRGSIQIPFACAGAVGAACKGRVRITKSIKAGRRTRTVGCGAVNLMLAAGHHLVVADRISKRCHVLLGTATHHRLGAQLRARFSTDQKPLSTRVTLVAG